MSCDGRRRLRRDSNVLNFYNLVGNQRGMCYQPNSKKVTNVKIKKYCMYLTFGTRNSIHTLGK
jgi:hypothetical protein